MLRRTAAMNLELTRPGDKATYDSKQGIEAALTSLESLNRLLQERRAAGYDRKEVLREFFIMGGKFYLDGVGNCSKNTGVSLGSLLGAVPGVLHKDEYLSRLARGKMSDRVGTNFKYGSDIPPARIVCSHCSTAWSVDHCDDTVLYHKHEVIDLKDFIGKTLGEVKAHYASLTSADYKMQSDVLIRNDKHIDRSPKYPGSEIDWEKELVKNELGWLNSQDLSTGDTPDTYVIAAGDEGFFNVWTFYHAACDREYRALETTAEFKKVFEAAGFKKIEIELIPNRYSSNQKATPWCLVQTELGPIVMGWRRRVINIDVSGVNQGRPHPISLTAIFSNEKVTKARNYIHAWGSDKATEYLAKIFGTLSI